MTRQQPAPPTASFADRCITPLLDVTEATEHGEKACRLGNMMRLGHPVPEGVVIGRDFFIETLSKTDTQSFIDARLRGLVIEDLAGIDRSVV